MTSQPFEPATPEPDPLPEGDVTGTAETSVINAGPPGASPNTARSSRLLVNGILGVAFAVLIGGVGFAAGRATTPAAATNPGSNGPLQGGIGAQGRIGAQGGVGQFPGGPGDDDIGRFRGAASLKGTVVSITSSSLTLKLDNGRTVEVAIDATTGYHRQADASASDVTTGSTVIVNVTGLDPGAQGSGPTAAGVTIVP